MNRQKHLVIMAKFPMAGRVKSRLAKDVGAIEALRVYRTMTAQTLNRLTGDKRWQSWLSVTPDNCDVSPFWPPNIDRINQGHGDLGERMQRIFDTLPPGPAIIVGTDIAGVQPNHIARAFRLLGNNDAVAGPASDGGYWLIGARRSPRVVRPFENVRWSSPNALGDTLANLKKSEVALADTLNDVDDRDDYLKWRSGS